jgi:hypothetical protein
VFPAKLTPRRVTFLSLLLIFLSGCLSPRVSQSAVSLAVTLTADGVTQTVSVPSGSKVQQVLETAKLTLASLDKVEPPAYALVTEGLTVKVTRGREEFETQSVVIPFERQTVRNESLPLGETKLIQPGQNGKREVVYRHYYEDGQLVNTSVSRSTVLEPALPEIIILGAQAPFAPLSLPGKLVYLASGNAWLMQGSTANRQPLVTTGDLDGRVLKLSRDGNWLLFTRKSTKAPEEEINTLWALNLASASATPINLKTPNVVHFADWDPTTVGNLRVLYSTVEPRAAAPGWQANNDLYRMVVGANGNLGVREKIIEANTGGVYGWWGTDYSWSPTGNLLAYSRPDGVGIVSFKNKQLLPLLEITPYQTRSDWALIPGLGWGADGRTLFVVTHAPPPGLVEAEESPNFDLSVISLDTDANIRLTPQSGMFAYPAASSLRQNGTERAYLVAYLQALSPTQSNTSGYRLVLMDRDGSNRQAAFPPAGSPGLQPQTPLWAPRPLSATEGDFVAVVYQGNLWLVDAATGNGNQVTGDGLIQKIDWK